LLIAAILGLLFQGGCQVAEGEQEHPINRLLAKIIPESPDVRWRKLAQHLRSPDADLRREGVLMLKKDKYRENVSTPELLQVIATGDPDTNVRCTALEVLALVDTDQVKLPEVLANRATDPAVAVREQVMALILKNGYAWAAPPAIDRLSNDSDAMVRGRAAMALKHYRNQPTIQALIAGLRDEEFSVCYHARQSLASVTGVNFGDDPQAWRNWYEQEKESFPAEASGETAAN
jgi:hypothetical protein